MLISEPIYCRYSRDVQIWLNGAKRFLLQIVLLAAGLWMGSAVAVFEDLRCPVCFREMVEVRYARVESLVSGSEKGDAFGLSEDAADTENQISLMHYRVVLRLSKDGHTFSGPLKISGVAAADTLPAQGTEGLLLLKPNNPEKGEEAWVPACAFPEGFFPMISASGGVALGPERSVILPMNQAWLMLSGLVGLRSGLTSSWQTETIAAFPPEQVARLWLCGMVTGEATAALARDLLREAMTDKRSGWLPPEGNDSDLFNVLVKVAWPMLLQKDKAEMTELLIAELDKHPCLIAPQQLQFLIQDGIPDIPDPRRRQSMYHAIFDSHRMTTDEGEIIHRVFSRFSEVAPWFDGSRIRDEVLNQVLLDIARGICGQGLLQEATDLMALIHCFAREDSLEGKEILRNIAFSGTLPAGMIIQDSLSLEKAVEEARRLIEEKQGSERSTAGALP